MLSVHDCAHRLALSISTVVSISKIETNVSRALNKRVECAVRLIVGL